MHIVDISIKKPVTILMGTLALMMYGILAYTSLPVSLLPETKMAVVTVQTVYAGASPEIIETQITKRIEDQVSAIADVNTVTSYSMDSVSIITIQFKDGKDENIAIQEVKDKIDVIQSDMPADAQKPSISKIDVAASIPIMNIILEGNMAAAELYTLASTTVRDELAQITGVGSVEISGGRKREIQVDVERVAVYERYLPVEQIAGILARAAMELPGGNIEIEGQDIPVRFRGEFGSVEEIADIDIQTQAGVFKLRQLAETRDTETRARERTIFFDKRTGERNEGSLLIRIQKNPSANTVGVIEAVQKRIPLIEATAGGNIQLKVIQEDATFIRDSVNDTWSNLIMGIVLTGLVLLVFLHDWRSTIIITIAMPFSIIATFFVMQLMGISINVLSLMGLSCVVGTLVANSVVVLENIFRYKTLGLSSLESASRGTKEVLTAVLASTLTNVAVFIPLGGMQGAMGQIISHFAYTVVISTVFSIVVSFTITPLLASRFLPEKIKEQGKISAALERFFTLLENGYGRSLKFILKQKRCSAAVIALTVIAFALAIVGFGSIEMEMVPKSDGGKIRIDVELPQGSSLERTAGVLYHIEEKIAAYDEVRTILTSLGNMGGMERDVSVARMEISLSPKKQRTLSNSVLAAAMMRTLSDIPGADIRVSAPAEIALAQGAAVNLIVQGPLNTELQRIGGELKQRVAAVPGVMNISVNTKSGKDELVFEPLRKQISHDGLTVQSIAVTLRAAVDGVVSSIYREGGEEYDIRVKMKDSMIRDIEDIRNIPVVSSAGIFPLSRYADIHYESGYNMIMRVDKSRTVEITADLLPGYAQGSVMAAALRSGREIELPQGYSIRQAGLAENMDESNMGMAVVFLSAIVLVYMLLAAILENILQPVFILSTIPLSLIGVTAGCLITGTVLNNIAMIGIVMLVGIVVNNAILLLDYYNQVRKEGAGVQEALLKACPAKLKPILMSNIAVILGTIPMALGIGESLAEMRQPMGIIVAGGIVSSTIMTLWLIPALEYVVKSRKGLKGNNL